MNRRELMKKGFLGALAAKILPWPEAYGLPVVEDYPPMPKVKPPRPDGPTCQEFELSDGIAKLYCNGKKVGPITQFDLTTEAIDVTACGSKWRQYVHEQSTVEVHIPFADTLNMGIKQPYSIVTTEYEYKFQGTMVRLLSEGYGQGITVTIDIDSKTMCTVLNE